MLKQKNYIYLKKIWIIFKSVKKKKSQKIYKIPLNITLVTHWLHQYSKNLVKLWQWKGHLIYWKKTNNSSNLHLEKEKETENLINSLKREIEEKIQLIENQPIF